MYKIRIAFIVIIASGMFSACLETETPTPNGVVMGEWAVDKVISNGQVEEGLLGVDATLHLDNNNSFLFVNIDGRASSGQWTAADSTLTLVGNDGYVQEYNIEYVDWQKLNIYRTFVFSSEAQIEIRYLFRRVEE